MPRLLPLVRFALKIRVAGDEDCCWLWTAARRGGYEGDEYGAFRFNGKVEYAHRVSYSLFVSPIEPGKHIDHICQTTLCVNPAHLRPASLEENNAHMVEANWPREGPE